MHPFKGYLLQNTPNTVELKGEWTDLALSDLPEGDVLIDVHYSSVNYKDGLAVMPEGKIVSSYPFVPGIDLSGIVIESNHPDLQAGDPVLVTGYGLGVSHFGGYSEAARVPAEWVVPLPDGMTLREAMIYGTAGFTAALALHRLEANGLSPASGPVLVTGASGGVGSLATAILAQAGYAVAAVTGKAEAGDFLRRLGAREILPREALLPEKPRPLAKSRWAGAIDPVGGETLAHVLSELQYGGPAAACGLAGGAQLDTTVYPFILRGAALLGIDSVHCPMALRRQLWQRLAREWKPSALQQTANEIAPGELADALASILQGRIMGRTIVPLHGAFSSSFG